MTGAIDDDRHEARRRAKATVGAMLIAYCHEGRASAATQPAVRDYNGLAPEEFERIVRRLALGETATGVIDDALLDRYAVAGTVSECLDRCDAYADAGATELGFSFAGDEPLHDIAASVARYTPLWARASHCREDDHGQRRVRPRAACHLDHDGHGVWGMD